MSVNAVSFRGTKLETKNSKKATVKSKVELKQEEDKVELTTKKQKPVRSFWGSIGGVTAGSLILGVQSLTAVPLLKYLPNLASFDGGEAEAVKGALRQTLVDSGLKEKGVNIKFLNPLDPKYENKGTVIEKIKKMANRILNSNNPAREIFDISMLDMFRKGQNAAFFNENVELTKMPFEQWLDVILKGGKPVASNKGVYIRANSVVGSATKSQGALFHELGHAMNFNLSKVGKFLQKCRPISMLAPSLLIMYGAFTRKSKPKEEGKELNGVQKTHNFVRNNAGKLAFAATLPILIEEGMATIKGQKYANKLLSPDVAKKILKGNMLGYATYLAAGVLGALGARAAVKVKDNAIAKKERKRAEKAERREISSLKSMDTYRSHKEGNVGGVELDKGALDKAQKEQGYVGTYRS